MNGKNDRMLPAFEGLDGNGLYTEEELRDYQDWSSINEAETRADYFYAGYEDYWNAPLSPVEVEMRKKEHEIVELFG